MKKFIFIISFLILAAVSFTPGQVGARQEVRENMCQRVKDRIENRLDCLARLSGRISSGF